MKLRYSPIAAALAIAISIGACSEESPTGNQLDPTLTTTPCDSAFSPLVGTNGFIMSGTGFQGQLVKFVDFERDVDYTFYGDSSAAVTYTINDTLNLAGDPTTIVTVDLYFPESKEQRFPFSDITGDSATYMRLELTQDGIGKKVYRSVPGFGGGIVLDSVKGGSIYIGHFCGILKDEASRSQIAIMSGKFSVSD